ncbi:MAG: ACP synthase [Candidatus Cloacimonetes bacterium HGW-Cloacimonetes-3]|nr:MAG: ACP synthase [Candidatus Cloacimonetes bacterium HGW-Cloacimonetes-3]
MIIGIGTDIIAISRIKKAIEANERFVDKIFTPQEISYCTGRANPSQSFAARFAAKEAVMKALGTGWDGIINWVDIEVMPDDKGCPKLILHGAAKQMMVNNNIKEVHISLSHEKDYAIAFAVLEG